MDSTVHCCATSLRERGTSWRTEERVRMKSGVAFENPQRRLYTDKQGTFNFRCMAEQRRGVWKVGRNPRKEQGEMTSPKPAAGTLSIWPSCVIFAAQKPFSVGLL